jgi:hypothetical protein
MKTENYPKFIELYNAYKRSDDYAARTAQFAIVEVNKEIISETLRNEPFLELHLTGLIQMFKFGCKDETFEKYLAINVADMQRREELNNQTFEINQWGYTGAGLNAVKGLSAQQVQTIKVFLENAFSVNTIEAAINLCSEFDSNKIPQVKSGIYSPWLYYINPELFPILNNSHAQFREWIDIPADYPSAIRDFNELRLLTNENELGVIDFFAHNFDEYLNPESGVEILNIGDKRLYKLSHGLFKHDKDYRETGLLDVLNTNNWISMHSNTGKGAGNKFQNHVAIGDYVYVCYGGDELYCLAKIISDAKPLPKNINDLFGGDGKWIYRETEPLFLPHTASIKDLKKERGAFMPSGNSTFNQVQPKKFDFINDLIFEPKFSVKIIGGGSEGPPAEKDENGGNRANDHINESPMNTILYGPPGTGKTFHSVTHAVSIVDDEPYEDLAEQCNTEEGREAIKQRYDQLVSEGRIVFTTFHQSMGYEDFVEGIKPVKPEEDDEFLSYDIEDGLFMRTCVEATYAYVKAHEVIESGVIGEYRDFNNLYDLLFDQVSEEDKIELSTRSKAKVYASTTSQGNFSITHKGKDKTYTVSRDRLSKLYEAFPNPSEVTNINKQFRQKIGGSNSTAYWSVLNKLAQIRGSKGSQTQLDLNEVLPYEEKREIVAKYWDRQITTPEQEEAEPFVMVIDEINRGNVSQIFGELITLLEADKRIGKKEVIYLNLPYSKKPFGVPPNLYIIGTMNTADRSVEALDSALRRRFSFIPMWPEEGRLTGDFDGINLSSLLTTINIRLKLLKDQDHTIGHAWLWGVEDFEALRLAFKDKIIPLLQEYFYNDFGKLGLVLGQRFVVNDVVFEDNIFAPFEDGIALIGQYQQKKVYKIKNHEDWNVADFRSIYNLAIEAVAEADA